MEGKIRVSPAGRYHTDSHLLEYFYFSAHDPTFAIHNSSLGVILRENLLAGPKRMLFRVWAALQFKPPDVL